MSLPIHQHYRFEVAFSFAGDGKRSQVRAVAELLRRELGEGKVFFDEWFEAELAGHDAQNRLQKIYLESTRLVVSCICQRYAEKPWTQDEWRAIQAFERTLRRGDAEGAETEQMRFLPLRFGDGKVDGIFETAIVPDVRDRASEEIASLILERLRLAKAASPMDDAEPDAAGLQGRVGNVRDGSDEGLPDLYELAELHLLDSSRGPVVKAICCDRHLGDIARLARVAFGHRAMDEDQIRELHGNSVDTVFVLEDSDGETRGYAAVMAPTPDLCEALLGGTADPEDWTSRDFVPGPRRWIHRAIYLESVVVEDGPLHPFRFSLLLGESLRHLNGQLKEEGLVPGETLRVLAFAASKKGRNILKNLLGLDRKIDAAKHAADLDLYFGEVKFDKLLDLQERAAADYSARQRAEGGRG